MEAVCVAFKAHQGWVNSVAVLIKSDAPRPVLTRRIDLIDSADRSVAEPYHVAGGWDGLTRVPRPTDPVDVIAAGRRQQVASARRALRKMATTIENLDLQWVRAVVLTGRGALGDDLENILRSHAQIHIAEGEAIRDATRTAIAALDIRCIDQDEKNILAAAAREWRCSPAACDERMKAARPATASSWRKEERLVALGAWLNRG